MDNNWTPQWFEFFVDLKEPLKIKLWDNNNLMKNSAIYEASIDFSKKK